MKEYTEEDIRNALKEVYRQLEVIREQNRYMLEKIREIHGAALERAQKYDEKYRDEGLQTAYGEMQKQGTEVKSDVGIHK